MGVLDKLKGATQAMTGGAAKVSIEYPLQTVFPNEPMPIRVTVVSSGGPLKSKGVVVDLVAEEKVSGNDNARCPRCGNAFKAPFNEARKTFEQSFPIGSAFELQPGETRVFEASLPVPSGAQPTFSGAMGHHDWKIRGRVQSFGNDPDSGLQPLRVGMK